MTPKNRVLPLATALLGAALAFMHPSTWAETARSADDFVDGIGYCIHVQNFSDADWNILRADLGASGVRQVRDGLEHMDNATHKARLQGLFDSFGIRTLAVCTPYGNNQLQDPNNVPSRVEQAKPFLLAVEGPNEPDIFWYDGWNMGGFTDRWDQLAWYQNNMYDKIKAYGPTANVTVTTPALAFGETADRIAGKNLKHDVLAWHHYNGHWKPNPWQLQYSRERYPSSKPAYLTEHGRNVNAHVTFKAQMKYDTRSLMHFFDSWDGNQKTFLYVFGPDGEDFGSHSAVNSPRPVYRSVKNLVNTLKEATWNTGTKTWNRPSFTPGNLDFSFAGDTSDLRTRLLQKSNGDFFLLAYFDVDSSTASKTDIDTARTLNLSLGTACTIVQHDFTDNGDLTTATISGGATTAASVTVRDRVTILKLTRSSASLAGEYYDEMNFTGTRVNRTDGAIDFNWGTGSPVSGIGADTFSARWTGRLQARSAGTYTFYATGDDGIEVWLSGTARLLNAWKNQGPTTYTFTQSLTASQVVDLKMEYFENGGGAVAKLEWSGPGFTRQVIPAAQFLPPSAGLINNGIYEIEPVCAPGKRLEVIGLGTADGSRVVTYTDFNSANQRWRLEMQSPGVYELIPQHATGKRMDVNGAVNTDGAAVQIWQDNGSSAQRWSLMAQSDGTYELEPQCAPGKRLDVPGGSTADGAEMIIWTDNNSVNQRWKLLLQ